MTRREAILFAVADASVPTVELRLAAQTDEPQVVEIVDAAYAPFTHAIGKEPAPMLDDYADLIERARVTVAVSSEQLVGLIVMWAKDDHWYVDNIAVDPAAHGRGIGRLLLHEADNRALAAGMSEVRLYTNVAMIENIEYYARRGFVETHRTNDRGFERVFFTKRLP